MHDPRGIDCKFHNGCRTIRRLADGISRYSVPPSAEVYEVRTNPKGKYAMPHEECRRGAHLPVLGREPVQVDKPLKSVTHGQCDARPTVTFPAAGRHRPLTGTKLYCLVTEARNGAQLAQGCYLKVERP